MNKKMNKDQFEMFVSEMKVGESINVEGENGIITLVSLVDMCESIGYLVGGYATGLEAFAMYECLDDLNAEEIQRLVDYVFDMTGTKCEVRVFDKRQNKLTIK